MKKIKVQLHYRKARRADLKEYRCCRHCKGILWTDIFSCAAGVTAPLHKDWRCKVVGLHNSRSYAIGINNLCDAFQVRKPGTVPEGA